jgi:hypothetical protein
LIPDKVPTQAKIQVYIAQLGKLTLILQWYGDLESLLWMEAAQNQLADMLTELRIDAKGGSPTSK